MPSGLSSAGVPSSGPDLKAEPTNDSATATTVNQTTALQRGVSGLPVGKSSGRNVKAGTMPKSQAQLPPHTTTATGPDVSAELSTTCRYTSLLTAIHMKKVPDEHEHPPDRIAWLT